MKKLNQLLAAIVLVSAVSFANGQAKVDTNPTVKTEPQSDDEKFFLGKWDLMVYGLPDGDTKMVLNLVKKDGELAGTFGDGGENDSKLTKIKISKNTIEMNFIGAGYNIPVYLDKKEDGTVEGSMNDMFDIKGKKAKE